MKKLSVLILLAAPLAAAPTFSKDVAPILFEHCVGCHRPNDIAPMSLLDYKSARPWAKSIREAVLTRNIATIQAWVDDGAPEGASRDLLPAPTFVDGWRQGKPDIVIDIGEDFTVKPGADTYDITLSPLTSPRAAGSAPPRSARATAESCITCM